MADEKKTVKVTADIDIQTNAQQMQKARAEIAALNKEIEDLKKQEEALRKIQDRTPIQQREYKNVLSSITSRQRQVKDLSSKASKSISVVSNNGDVSKYIKDAQQSRRELTGLEKEEAELYARIREEKKKKNEELRKELSSLEGEEKSFNISSNSGSYAPLSQKEKDAQKAYEKAFKAEQKRQLEGAQKEAYYRKKAKSMSVKDIAAAKEKYGNVSKRTWSKTNFAPNMDAINKSAADRAAEEIRESYGLSKYYSFKNREKRQSNYGSLSKSGQKTLSGYLDSIAKIDEKADEALKVIWEKMAKEQGVSYESFLASKLSKTSGFGSHLSAKEIKAQKELVEKEQARVNRERILQGDLRNPNAYNTSREAIQRRSNIKFGDNKTLPAYDKTKKIIEDSYQKGRAKLTHEQIQNIFDAVLNESDLKIMSGALKQGAPIDAAKSFITRNGYGTFVGNDGHIVVGGYKNADGNLVPAQSYKINSDNYLAKINAQGFKLGKKGQVSLYDIDEFYSYINDLIAIEAKKAGPEAKKEVQRLTEVANDVIAMVTEAIGNTNLDSIKNSVLGKFSATEKGMSGADFESNAPFVRNSAFYKAMQTRFSQSPSDFDMGLTEQNTEKVPQYDPEKVRKDEIKEAKVQAEAEAESNNRNNEFGKFMKEDLTKWLTEVFKSGGANALNDAIQLVINQIKEQLKGNVQEGQFGTISFGGDIVDAGFNAEGKMLTVTNHEKFDEDNRDMVYNEEFLAKEKEEIVATEEEIESNTEKFSVTMRKVLATIVDFVRQTSDASDSLDDKQALGKIGDRLERRFYKGEGNEEKSLDQNFQEAFNRMARMITTGKVLQGNWVREAEKNGTTPIVEMQKTIEGIEDIDERDEYTQQVISAMSAYQRFKEALGEDGENIENAIKAFFEGGGREIEEIYNQYKMFSNNPKMLKRFQEAVMIETTPRGWGANRASASQNIGVQQVMPKDKGLKTADLSPKERFIQLYGQGQAVLGTFATTDLDIGLQRANKRLEEAKNKQVVSEEKIAKAKEILANMQEKYGTKTTRFGTKIDFKTPLWADDTDLTEKQIAQQVGEDEKAYKKAQRIINGSTNNDAEIVNLEEKIKLIKEAIEAQKKMYDVSYFGQSDENLDAENQAMAKKMGLIKDETTAEQEKVAAIEKTTQALQQQKAEENSLPEPDYDLLYEDMTASLQQSTQAVEQNAQIAKQSEDKKQAEAEETAKAEKNKKEAVDEVSDALRKQAEEEAKAAEEAKKARTALSGKADFSEIDDLPWDTSDEDRPAVQAAIDEQNAKWRKDMHRESQMEWIRNPANRGFGVGMDSREILDAVLDKPAEENLDWKKGIREYEAATQNVVKALGQIYESQQKIKQIQEEINNLQSNENGLNKEQLALLETQKAAEENKLAQAQVAYEAAGRRKEESGIREQVQGKGSAFPASLARQVQQIDYYAESQLREIKANVDAKNTYQTKGVQNKRLGKSITSYLNQYKQILKIQEQIDADEKRLASSGMKGERADNIRSVVNMRKRLLGQLQAEMPNLDLEKGELNGQKLSEEELIKLKKETALLESNHGIQIEKNNALQKQSVSLVQQIAQGFKASFRNLTDYSAAYMVIGKIKMAYSQLINYAEQLNASMVDLQIASGLSYSNIKNMMLDFNDLAVKVGKSTLEVSQAANDWLRAGYEGQDAATLVENSMQLSTLGMINSAEATEYLISMLKGWKLQVNEVSSVVDKLVAVDMSAAISAGDLATALARANTSAQLAGSSLDNYIAYTTVVAETTQKSAESVGESFKTLYARFGKIAAGKFETSQEELEQQGLTSEDMSNLNEIEQVLKAVGIELRDTPEHFRDIDSVLAEIAGKWNTFSDVQKSGISTAVAGTRQRENFLVLMENWDNVGKYAEIAANAYGTAVEKMEAYSQGVEAARKRVQAAWEGFALIVNESGLLETAFNGLATAIENIHWIILAAITSLVASNPAGAAATLSQAFTKLSLTLGSTGLEQKLGLVGDSQSTVEAAKQARIDMADAAFVRQKQILWGDYLGKFKGGMNDERFSGFTEYQSGLIGLDKTDENEKFIAGLTGFASALQAGEKGATLATESLEYLRKNIDEGKAQILLNTVSKETANTLVLSQKKNIEQGMTEEQLADQTAILAEARKRAAMQLLDDMGTDKSQYYSESDRKVFTTATGNAQKSRSQSRQKLAANAVGSLFGSIAGGYGGSKGLGGIFAKVGGEDARSAGESIGSIIGMVAGQKAVTSLIANMGKGLTGKAFAAGVLGPWAAVVALIFGAGYGIYQLFKKKAIEKAQSEFKELKETYESQLSGSTKTSRYDELSEGVDQFGRNVSLTDEEYAEFLSTSNELAELFPELVVRTDEAGNSFLGTAGKVSKLAEAVDDMVKASQKAADVQLLSDNVFDEAFKDAKASYKKNSSGIKQLQEEVAKGGYWSNTFKLGQAGPSQIFTAYSKKELEEKKSEIKSMEEASRNVLSSLTDYNNAIMREDFGLQATLSSMSEDSAILAKQTMQKVFSSLDLTEYANEDEYRADIEKISNEIADLYKENPILATLEVEMGSSSTSGEYYAIRQQILQNILNAFGDYATWDENQKKLVFEMGFKWDEDTGWVDTTDIRQKIKDEGLDSHLGKDVNLNKYSVNDLETAYTILKGTFADNVYSDSGLQNAIFQTKYQDVELSKAAQLYEQYTSIGRELTEVEKVQKDFIEKKLDKWASELDVVQGDYDEIIRKAKIIGNLDFGGVSTLNPDENWDRLENYAKWAKYLEDERLKTGKWDIETLNQMSTYSELQPFIANDDAEGMLKYLNEVVGASENSMNQSYQKMYTNSKEGTKALQELHKDLLDEVEEDYDIDFRKFETAADAKVWLAKYSAAIASQNWSDWKDSMIQYYQDVLAEATTDTQKMILLNGEVIKQVKKAQLLGSEEYVRRVQLDYKANGGDMSDVDAWNEYLNQQMGKDYIDQTTEEMLADLDEAMTKYQNGKKLNLDSKDKGTSDLNKEIERIEALIGMYQKEYYLRKSLIEQGNLTAEGQDSFMSPEYYARMREAYELQAKYYSDRIPWNKDISDWSAEQMGYYQKYQQAMINLNNLDDEQVEDKINILQLQDASLDTLIKMQKEYIATSDTLQERLEREKELNELIEERRKLYRDTQEYERWIADYNISNLKGTAYSNPDLYDQQIGIKKSTIENQQNSLIESIDAAKRRIASHLMQTEGLNAEEAYLKAAQSEEVRSLMKEYYELAKEYSEVIMESINAKVDEISKKIDNVDKERPKQWTSVSQIEDSYDSEVDYINKQIDIYREALKDVSKLNDDQINELVDGLNEAVISLHEAKINRGESIKELQEKQYSAAIAQIDIYKQEIQDAIDAIETAYDKEYNKIKENNTERERAIKLEDLLAAKKKAAQEKEKVYVEGIGWTYRSNRSAQKEAQENLDSFYREDRLTDLEETKNADVKRLEQRISDWEAYAKALEYKYGAHDREENQKLLMDLLGVDNMDDVRDKMTGDMTSYVTEAKEGLDNFTELSYDFKGTIEAIYKDYNTIFNDFLNDYKKNLEELQELYEESLKMEDASGYLNGNDAIIAPYVTPSNAANEDLLAKMMERSEKWFDIQKEINSLDKNASNYKEMVEALKYEQSQLHDANTADAKTLDAVMSKLYGNNWSAAGKGYTDVTVGGKTFATSALYVMGKDGTAYTPEEAAKELDRLSKAWWDAKEKGDEAAMKEIADKGNTLGTGLGGTRDENGVWHFDSVSKAGGSAKSSTEVINGQTYTKTDNSSGGKHWSTSSGGGESSGKGTYSSSDGKYTIGSKDGQNFHDNAKAGDTMTGRDGSTWTKNSDGSTTISKNGTTYTVDKGHANGILGGPITYTGLSMLHGTPSTPEYVLNADQAYTLLRNISTMQIPEYTSLLSNAGETQYILQGDVIIDGTENPENFWDAVTNQMRNRYSVTKNNKRA